MEEVEGFEPPRGVTRLSVFKTDPFSRTWVYLRIDKNYNSMYYFHRQQKFKYFFQAGRFPARKVKKIFYSGVITFRLRIYGRNTSGMMTLPSACW